MSLKRKLISFLTLAFATLTLTAFVSAQDKTYSESTAAPEKQDRRAHRKFDGERRGGRGMRGPGHMLRGLHGLDLTDAQKEQVKGIMESKRGGMEQTREQLRTLHEAKRSGTITADQQSQLDSLRAQMKQNADATEQQILAILTPEQRTKLEERKAEMQKRRQEFREMRRERGPRPGTTTPADKPTDN